MVDPWNRGASNRHVYPCAFCSSIFNTEWALIGHKTQNHSGWDRSSHDHVISNTVFQKFFIHGEILRFSNKIWLTYPHYNNPTLNVIICCWTLQPCMIRTQWISTFWILRTPRILRALRTLKTLRILPINRERLMVHKYRSNSSESRFIQFI